LLQEDSDDDGKTNRALISVLDEFTQQQSTLNVGEVQLSVFNLSPLPHWYFCLASGLIFWL